MPESSSPSAVIQAAPRADLVLRLCGTSQNGRLVRLRGGKTTIGSGSQCSVRLQAPGVQPLHCLFLQGPEQTIVRGCAGETRVNGKTVGEANLVVGDRLAVGPIEFQVVECGHSESFSNATASLGEDTVRPANSSVAISLPAMNVARTNPTDASRHERQKLAARQGRARARRLITRLRELRRENELNALQLHRLQEAQTAARDLLAQRDAERQRLNEEQLRAEALWDKQRRRLSEEQRELDGERKDLETHRLQLQRERDQSLADLARRADDLNTRSAELDKLRRDLESQQRQRLVEIDSKSAELARHREQLMHDREGFAAEAEEERLRLDAQRQEIAEQTRRLSAESRQLAESQDALEQRRLAIEEEQTAVAQKRAALESEKATLHSERNAWEHDRSMVERMRSLAQEERTAIEQEQTALEQARSAVESQQMLLQQELREFEAHKHSLTLERLDWQTETSRAEAELAGRREELDRRAASLAKQHADQESARRRLDDSQKSLARRQETLEQAEADLLERKRQFHEQELALENERQTLQQAQSLLASDRQLLAGEQAAFSSERQSIEVLRQQCRTNENEWSQRLADQTRQLTEATERLNRATHELEQQQALLEAARRELDDERQTGDIERGRLQHEYEEQLKALREQLDGLRNAEAEQCKQADDDAAKYDHRWDELNQWARDLEQLAEELRQQADELAEGRKRLEERLAAADRDLATALNPRAEDSLSQAERLPISADFSDSENGDAANQTCTPTAWGEELNGSEPSYNDQAYHDQAMDADSPDESTPATDTDQRDQEADSFAAAAETTFDASSSSMVDEAINPLTQYEPADRLPDVANEHADESIDDYMARLLKRVRGTNPSSSAPSHTPPAVNNSAAIRAENRSTALLPPPATEVPRVEEVPAKLTRRTPAPELSSDLKAMRELANMTARAAIDKHAYRNWGRAAFGKMVIALLAGGAGGGAVYFAPARDSMLMYAGLSCFVIALFWLLQAGILVKNVIRATRRHSRFAAEHSAPGTNAVAPDAATQSEDLPPAEIITVCDNNEFQSGAAAEPNGNGDIAECIGEKAPAECTFATADEQYEAPANPEEATVVEPVSTDLVAQG